MKSSKCELVTSEISTCPDFRRECRSHRHDVERATVRASHSDWSLVRTHSCPDKPKREHTVSAVSSLFVLLRCVMACDFEFQGLNRGSGYRSFCIAGLSEMQKPHSDH